MQATKLITIHYSYQASDGMIVYDKIPNAIVPNEFELTDLDPNKNQILKSLVVATKGPLNNLQIHTPTEFNFLNLGA